MTMKFLSMIRGTENTGKVPSEKMMKDMFALMEQMTREGVLLNTAGLMPTAAGKRMRFRNGKVSITDGPFAETKEVVGGFAILEAPSMEKAMELTKRFLAIHDAQYDIECEVRPFAGPDFGVKA
jgi:hypothetical protein